MYYAVSIYHDEINKYYHNLNDTQCIGEKRRWHNNKIHY
jgi:hypothetical protein